MAIKASLLRFRLKPWHRKCQDKLRGESYWVLPGCVVVWQCWETEVAHAGPWAMPHASRASWAASGWEGLSLWEYFPQTLIFTVLVVVSQSKLMFTVHNWNSSFVLMICLKDTETIFSWFVSKAEQTVIKRCLLFRILITAYSSCYSSVNTCIWLTGPIVSFLGGTCHLVKEWFVYFGNPLKGPDLIQPVQPPLTGRIKMCINLNWKNHFTKNEVGQCIICLIQNPGWLWRARSWRAAHL